MLENLKDNLENAIPNPTEVVAETKAKVTGMWERLKAMGYSAGSIIVIGGLLSIFLPWWIVVVVAAGAGYYFGQTPLASYTFGLAAVTALWSGYAGFLDSANAGILSTRMGKLIGGLSGTQLIWATGFLGGIVGGFGALTGALAREAFGKK